MLMGTLMKRKTRNKEVHLNPMTDHMKVKLDLLRIG